jgi:hypothetical protein
MLKEMKYSVNISVIRLFVLFVFKNKIEINKNNTN